MSTAIPIDARGSWPAGRAPWIASIFLATWIALMLAVDGGLYGDNVEQTIWSHSMQWGYYKHPPLPTWLLGAFHLVTGQHWWSTSVLAGLCLLATLWLTWSIARELLGARSAAAAVVWWGLLQCFSSRAQLYNHNTVLVLTIAVTVWCLLRALRGGSGWWVAVGLAAGAALLAKYQAAIALAGLLAVLVWSGRMRESRVLRGIASALLIAAATFAPHLAWLFSHDFSTLRYASQSVEQGGFGQRLMSDLSFLVNQLRMVLPALIALALCAFLARRTNSPATVPPSTLTGASVSAAEEAQRQDPSNGISTTLWTRGLFSGLLMLILLLPLLLGVNLRNHWGVQTFQFFTLWLAWRLHSSSAISLPRLTLVAGVIHVLSMLVYLIDVRDPGAMAAARRVDNAFPGRRLADAATLQWQSATRCPLRFLVGDFEAGLTSAYLPESPAVYVGPIATPWISSAQLRQHGALYILDSKTVPPAGTEPARRLMLGSANGREVWLAVAMPADGCRP